MSSQETHIGTIKELKRLEDETFEQMCERLYLEQNKSVPKDDWYDTYAEALKDCDFDKFYINEKSETVYAILNDKASRDDVDVSHAVQTGDAIDYIVSFYNGGCSFPEALDSAIERMKPTVFKAAIFLLSLYDHKMEIITVETEERTWQDAMLKHPKISDFTDNGEANLEGLAYLGDDYEQAKINSLDNDWTFAVTWLN